MVSVKVGLCPGSVSVQWELLCPGDLCLGGLNPGKVSVLGPLSGEGLCLGGLCPVDGPHSGGDLCSGDLCLGDLCPGGLCPGVSLSRVASVWGGLCHVDPRYGNVWAVRILLECILVSFFSC